MPKVMVGMTISVDGFVEDGRGSVGALYPDLDALRESQYLQDEIQNTGAVVMGRQAFAMAQDPDTIAESYEFQVPIFVLTHQPPAKKPRETSRVTFTFVTGGIESAIRQAIAAAGSKDVQVIGGPNTMRQCIQAGLADELNVDIMPVLLGQGLRLFEAAGVEPVHLERLEVTPLPSGRTHLRFRILK